MCLSKAWSGYFQSENIPVTPEAICMCKFPIVYMSMYKYVHVYVKSVCMYVRAYVRMHACIHVLMHK